MTRNIRNRSRLGLFILLCGLAAVPESAAAFRCGSRIIERGDSAARVLALCGEPALRDSHPQAIAPGLAPLGEVAQWYYDFGPNRLIEVLHFQNGRLQKITTAGYGFTRPLPRHCEPGDIDSGMTKYELLARCGDPATKREWVQLRTPDPAHPSQSYQAVYVEEWTYNFGPDRLTEKARLVNGVVERVASGDAQD